MSNSAIVEAARYAVQKYERLVQARERAAEPHTTSCELETAKRAKRHAETLFNCAIEELRGAVGPSPAAVTRCFDCGTEFAAGDELLANAAACPACSSTSVPMTSAEDLRLKINWHELRCLVQWAENYVLSRREDGTWQRGWERLKARIRAQRPEGSATLTLMEEVQELRDAGFNVTYHEGPPR